jgi:hypothetical protein
VQEEEGREQRPSLQAPRATPPSPPRRGALWPRIGNEHHPPTLRLVLCHTARLCNTGTPGSPRAPDSSPGSCQLLSPLSMSDLYVIRTLLGVCLLLVDSIVTRRTEPQPFVTNCDKFQRDFATNCDECQRDGTSTAPLRAGTMCWDTRCMGLDQKPLILNKQTLFICTGGDRDPTVPVTQCNGLCHVTL